MDHCINGNCPNEARYYISMLGEDRYSARVCIDCLSLMLQNAPDGTIRIVTVAIPQIR